MKYRSEPTVVDAEQFWPEKEPLPHRDKGPIVKLDGERWYVTTIHGQETTIVPGDWIIMEPDGEHAYPVKPGIFAQRYREVDPTRETTHRAIADQIVEDTTDPEYRCPGCGNDHFGGDGITTRCQGEGGCRKTFPHAQWKSGGVHGEASDIRDAIEAALETEFRQTGHLEIDLEAQAAYLHVQSGLHHRTVADVHSVNADFDEDDNLLGVEFVTWPVQGPPPCAHIPCGACGCLINDDGHCGCADNRPPLPKDEA